MVQLHDHTNINFGDPNTLYVYIIINYYNAQ